jgi:MYXO-CTERM domain-containing protein
MRSSSILAAAAAVLAIASSASADVITDWNGTGIEILRDRAVGPNKSTRALAIAQLAAYDAVVAITKTHEPYLPGLEAELPASPEAAAAQAAHDVLLALYPDAAEELADALEDSLDAIEDGDAEDNGVALGKDAAEAILDARAADHSADPATHDPSDVPGEWRPTPPANAAAADPQWGTVTPFALESSNQFRPAAPPALDSVEYTLGFTEVKLWGKATGSARNAEQTAIAKFWEQATHIPFYAIARSLAKREKLELDESARLFALLSLALADSRIATWDAKYTYNYWRPVTAITTVPVAGEGGAGGEGIDDDGNPETTSDPAWLPYLTTPNHPEYVSGHSATGAAAAGVLAYWFGDDTSFAVGSDSAPGFTRSFESFSDAADQNAISRLYGGIHYSFSNEAGLALGAEVAGYVVDHYLLEVDNGGGEGGAGGEGAGGTAPEPSEGGEGGEPPKGTGGTAGSGGTGEAGAPDSGGEGGAADASGGTGGKPPKANVDKHDGDDSGCTVSSTGGDRNAAGWLAVVAGLGLALTRRRR